MKQVKMKTKSKYLFLFTSIAIFLAIAIIACKKEVILPNQNELNQQTGFQYDNTLLQEFKSWQEKIADRSNNDNYRLSNKQGRTEAFKRNPHLDSLIDNYLKFQADSLIKKKQISNSVNVVSDCGSCGESGTDATKPTTKPITGFVHISGTITNNLTFQVKIDASNKIVGSSFSVSGTTGVVSQVGSLSQQTSQGTTSFVLYLQDQMYIGGLGYTQNYIVYGNIYQDQMYLNASTYDPDPVE